MRRVMSSSPVMLKHLCPPRCRRGSPGPGRRPAPFLRALGAAGASRHIWLRSALADDSEVAGWSILGLSELARGWGGRSRAGRGS